MGTRYVFSMTTSDSAKPWAMSPRWRRDCWEMLTALAGLASADATATPPWAMASLVSASVPASATGAAPGCMDCRVSTAAGRTSYSTSIRSSASSAMASSSAATAATGCPTKITRSMARTAWARVGALRFSSGMSAAVRTARTPGSARAFSVLMRTMRACAWGLLRSLAWSRPRGLRSATYWTWPVTFSGPSGRGMESPIPLTSRVVFITVAMAMRLLSCARPGRRGPRPRAVLRLSRRWIRADDLGDGRQHLGVPGAPAEIARDAVADLRLGGVRILVEQGRGGHQHAGDAEPALRHPVPHEGLLQ